MARDTIKCSLEGDVSLAEFQAAIAALNDLLDALTDEANPQSGVEWFISELRAGSATIELKSRFETAEDEAVASDVWTNYTRLAESAYHGRIEEFAPPVREAVTRLHALINGHIKGVKLGTDHEEWSIHLPAMPPALHVKPPSVVGTRASIRTSVKGQVVTLDQKRGLYFTLREAYTNHNVRCYPTPTWTATLSQCFARKAWILVEGTLRRFTLKPTLTDITAIVPLADAEPGGWRLAVGIAPRKAGGSTERAADVVRRMRDAE